MTKSSDSRDGNVSPDLERDPSTERLLKDAKIENEIPVQKATIIPKTLFFAEFVIYLGILLMIVIVLVFYSELWSLPLENHSEFHYPITPLAAVYLTGLVLFSLGSIYRLIFLESDQKVVWWIGFFGCLLTFIPPALMIVRDYDFVAPLVFQRLRISGGHKAVYALTAVSVLIMSPCVMALNLYGKVMKRARFHKLLIGMGILLFQLSTIVTIHSFIVQIGFGICLFGIIMFTTGIIVGKIESRKKEAQQAENDITK